MLKTLKQFAKDRGYSRQYVYQIKNKINVIDLPVFVEYNGEKIQIGTQKFVLVNEK